MVISEVVERMVTERQVKQLSDPGMRESSEAGEDGCRCREQKQPMDSGAEREGKKKAL